MAALDTASVRHSPQLLLVLRRWLSYRIPGLISEVCRATQALAPRWAASVFPVRLAAAHGRTFRRRLWLKASCKATGSDISLGLSQVGVQNSLLVSPTPAILADHPPDAAVYYIGPKSQRPAIEPLSLDLNQHESLLSLSNFATCKLT
ncbi:hypothetical protein LshimejAT787_0106460 [Lyophyllum shimeji]|uniref:Uncharacterized protein n=1 Tax=Lyophyllum shimeji TaxID=47721 RepID=A0A9P3UI59_LYOSH|nr:hypothetical protein LshimejAT787_0106460 [Lyophyllum shimeji]